MILPELTLLHEEMTYHLSNVTYNYKLPKLLSSLREISSGNLRRRDGIWQFYTNDLALQVRFRQNPTTENPDIYLDVLTIHGNLESIEERLNTFLKQFAPVDVQWKNHVHNFCVDKESKGLLKHLYF